jgi:hypothetical protein
MKKTILASVLSGCILMGIAAPAFAETASSTPPNASVKIACVGSAVNAREQALDAALSNHAAAITAAYSARADALKDAYSKTDVKSVRSSVRAAWSAFNASVKSARKAWNASKSAAWTSFRTAAAKCKAPADVSDSANASSEVSGN